MMRVWKNISLETEDRVMTIHLNRPPLNILNLELMNELMDALTSIAKKREAGIVVLRSELDGVFSAGADVKEHLPESAEKLINSFEQLINQLITFPRPTVSVVQGSCLGGGMELALACDFVFATERAVFGQPEVKVGVYPPAAAALLPRLTGLKNTYRLLLTGQSISAAEAASMGLVTFLVREEELHQRLRKFLNELLENSSAVLEFAKRAIYENLALQLDEALHRSSQLYLEGLMKTEDAAEGLNAFLQKRKPVWKHR